MRTFDVLQILQLGTIGLGFLLAFLAYRLLAKKPRKPVPIYVFMGFSLSIIVLGFASELLKQGVLGVSLDRNYLSFQVENVKSLNNIDATKYYISSEDDVAFRLPLGPGWEKPKIFQGIKGLFEINRLSSQVLNEQEIEEGLSRSPIGEMIKKEKIIHLVNTDSKLDVEVTESTTNEQIQGVIDTYYAGNDPNDPSLKEKMNEMRKVLVGFDKMTFHNQCAVTVFDKALLQKPFQDLSLASFGILGSSIMGFNADKLVADENHILLAVGTNLKNIKINNQVGNLNIYKWMLIAENKKRFFIVEITYSPETNQSLKVWDELQSIAHSLKILDQ